MLDFCQSLSLLIPCVLIFCSPLLSLSTTPLVPCKEGVLRCEFDWFKSCFYALFFIFPTDDENITVVDNAALKQGCAGLVALILEAVKMVSDFSSIKINRALNLLMIISLSSLSLCSLGSVLFHPAFVGYFVTAYAWK